MVSTCERNIEECVMRKWGDDFHGGAVVVLLTRDLLEFSLIYLHGLGWKGREK